MKDGYYWFKFRGNKRNQIVEVVDNEVYITGNDQSQTAIPEMGFTPVQDMYQDIVDFHREVMQDSFPKYPHIHSSKRELRITLIKDEIKETLEALENNDLVELADGIADSIVVLLGTAVTYGIDIRPIWDEVHRTNMAKKDGPMRADGKRMKPPGWKEPRIRELLNEQGAGL